MFKKLEQIQARQQSKKNKNVFNKEKQGYGKGKKTRLPFSKFVIPDTIALAMGKQW